MDRVDDLHRKASRSARLPRRAFPRHRERQQSGRGREPSVGLDRQAGGDQRRAGAAHGGYLAHQRIAVSDPREPHPVGDQIGRPGERDDAAALARIVPQRLIRRRRIRERGKLAAVEPHDRRLLRHQGLGKGGARLRALDEHRIEHPWAVLLARRADGDLRRIAPLAIECAEIDQQRIRAGDELPDLLGGDRHRRHRAGGQQHVGRECLRHRIGEAVHARPLLSQARKNVGGDVGQVGSDRVGAGRVVFGCAHLSSLRRHDPDQVRWVG